MDQRHSIPLETVVSKSLPGQKTGVFTLYAEAERLFRDDESSARGLTRARVSENVKREEFKKPCKTVTAMVTENESGFYIQLAGVLDPEGKVIEGPFLTMGRLYIQETKNPQLSNTAMKIFG